MINFRDLIDSRGRIVPQRVMQTAHALARIAVAKHGDSYAAAFRDALKTAWARAIEVRGMWHVRAGIATGVAVLMPVVDGIAHERRV